VLVALKHELDAGRVLGDLVRPGGERLVVQVDAGVLVRRQRRARRQRQRERQVAVRLGELEADRLVVGRGQAGRERGLVGLEVPLGVVVGGVGEPLLHVRGAAGEVGVERAGDAVRDLLGGDRAPVLELHAVLDLELPHLAVVADVGAGGLREVADERELALAVVLPRGERAGVERGVHEAGERVHPLRVEVRDLDLADDRERAALGRAGHLGRRAERVLRVGRDHARGGALLVHGGTVVRGLAAGAGHQNQGECGSHSSSHVIPPKTS
jgi:hypothetical protein